MSIAFKKMLEETFASSEVVGVYIADAHTGELEEEFSRGTRTRPFEPTTHLPNGEEMFYCSNCAEYVIEKLGEGRYYGFSAEDNPVTNSEVADADGHDFAVIRGRYIVDLWISLYTEDQKQVVYDLQNKADHQLITEIFGDPDKWGMKDPDSGDYYEADEVPEEFKLRLGRQPDSPAYSM